MELVKFQINSMTETYSRPDLERFLSFVSRDLDAELSQFMSISITFVERGEMAALNGEYRGVKGATDILTFALEGVMESDALGDIYLCPEEFKDDFEVGAGQNLLHFLVAHGVLHLLGYTHETQEKLDEMVMIQKKLVHLEPWKSASS